MRDRDARRHRESGSNGERERGSVGRERERERAREKASVIMQRLSDPTETVLSNNITRNRTVLSFKDRPREPLLRRRVDLSRESQRVLDSWRKYAVALAVESHRQRREQARARGYKTRHSSVRSNGSDPELEPASGDRQIVNGQMATHINRQAQSRVSFTREWAPVQMWSRLLAEYDLGQPFRAKWLGSEGCAIIYYQVPKYQVLAFATPFRAKHIRPSSRRYRLLTSPANRPSASLTCKLRRAKEQRAAAASGRTSVSLPLSRLPPSECS